MIERDWKVEIPFLHGITGIDLKFFTNYMSDEEKFELIEVKGISSNIIN